MNWKKFFTAFIAAFVFIFAFGFIWYGKLLHGIHSEVPALWRPEMDAPNYMSWLILGHVVMSFFLTMLCARYARAGRARARDSVSWSHSFMPAPTSSLMRCSRQ